MFNRNDGKETKAKEVVNFTFARGGSIIWRLVSYGLAIDFFAALVAIPIIGVMLLFFPAQLQAALDLLNKVFN